ncbi:HAD family hydrolase [Paenibacillus rhizovicinus]|uniref:HAD family hydrolase n=1 Tax=Paenibacillus rhizovicinus TaxID=2704463 RepID=A0A6C0NUQ9_9BACL|nr:HAD family hydrolase [Paenibacillus rhizovicinus]QHW29930.1 HAD family hydrolase [Paenibacillus rhizovicinus]
MERIKAVLFDLDNTILDRTRMFSGFAGYFFETYFGHIADRGAMFERVIELDRDGYKPRETLFAELLDELPWERKPSHEELAEFYRGAYLRHAVLMEQAREVLAHAGAKYRTGLITNGRMATQYGKIDLLGIRDAFEIILVSEEAGIKKPDKRIFELAADKLGLQAEECLFIGDHPVNDVEGAARFGMATIWVQANHAWPASNEAKPLHTINRLGELLALI